MTSEEGIAGALPSFLTLMGVAERVNDFGALTIKIDDLCALPVMEGDSSGRRCGNSHVECG